MKAVKVSLFEKPSIADHNDDTIYIFLSTLDVPVISVHALLDLRLPTMHANKHGRSGKVCYILLTLRHDFNTFAIVHQ